MQNVIVNDSGGSIVQHAFDYTVMALNGVHFEVMYCVSACVMAITLPVVTKDKICVVPQAWIGYHTDMQRSDGTESPTTMHWERGKDWIKNGYQECSR